jgi:GT2 family glycosyltransferase
MSQRGNPLVGVVVLNWNLPGDTIRCVRSVVESKYAPLHPMVVDNASSDDSVARIRAAFPELELVCSEANRGYTGGNNLGLARALELGVDYVFVLNNDTVVEPDCIARLVEAAEWEDRAALVGPMVIDEPEGIVGNLGGEIVWSVAEPRELGRGGQPGEVPLHRRDVEYIPGTAVLVRADAVREVGLLPGHFFIYFEDVAWSLLFQSHGWRAVVEPRARVRHWHSATMGYDTPIKLYYYIRNNLYFIRDWCEPAQRRSTAARFHAKCVKLVVKNLMRARITHLRAIFAAQMDFRRDRSGKTRRRL